MKLRFYTSSVVAKMVLGKDGKPETQTLEFGGRRVTAPVYQNTTVEAGQIIDVDDEAAAEFIERGAAVEFDPDLDSDALDADLADGEEVTEKKPPKKSKK